jgi:hypothetical protein
MHTCHQRSPEVLFTARTTKMSLAQMSGTVRTVCIWWGDVTSRSKLLTEFRLQALLTDKFDVHRSVHRNIFLYWNQKDVPVSPITYSSKMRYIYRTVFPSIIRSSRLYTQQAYVKQLLLPAASSCLTYACCCVYSLELLMMDGKTVRNM